MIDQQRYVVTDPFPVVVVELDDELEWDDALEEWEQELEQEGTAKAESKPMPAAPNCGCRAAPWAGFPVPGWTGG